MAETSQSAELLGTASLIEFVYHYLIVGNMVWLKAQATAAGFPPRTLPLADAWTQLLALRSLLPRMGLLRQPRWQLTLLPW